MLRVARLYLVCRVQYDDMALLCLLCVLHYNVLWYLDVMVLWPQSLLLFSYLLIALKIVQTTDSIKPLELKNTLGERNT